MNAYHNVMEDLVEEVYAQCASPQYCCTCEQCHADVIAYALNRLPPQYAATSAGERLAKASNLRRQHMADIQTALAQAFGVVSANPHHDQAR